MIVTTLEQQINGIYFPSYRITYQRTMEALSSSFSPTQLKNYLWLYEKAQSNPKQVKKELEEFQKNYPEKSQIYNLLSYVYIRLKKLKKAEKLIELNYQKNPNCLMAKINYADQCLRKKKAHLLPEILNHQFDLHALYPDKKIFHSSEILGFMCLLGFYQIHLGSKEKALAYLNYAKLIDSLDPAVLLLQKRLHKRDLIKKLFFKLKKLF